MFNHYHQHPVPSPSVGLFVEEPAKHTHTRLHIGSWLKTPHPDQDLLINVQLYTPFTNTHFRCGVLKVVWTLRLCCRTSVCVCVCGWRGHYRGQAVRQKHVCVYVCVCGLLRGHGESLSSFCMWKCENRRWIIRFLWLIHWIMLI